LLAQIAAEGVGLPVEQMHLHYRETYLVPTSVGSSVNAHFYTGGGAVKRAAEQLRRQVLAVAGRMLSVQPEVLKLRAGVVTAPGGQSMTLADIAGYALTVEHRHIITSASWEQQQLPTSFAAHGVEVEVDVETGAVRVIQVVSAVDTGHIINPLVCEAHIQGNVMQALGMGLSEELLYNQKGVPLVTDLGLYHVLNMAEMPELHTYLVESDAPAGPFGAKSAAEVALCGVTAALANAVHDALRVRIHYLPLTPERVLRALHAQSTQGAKK
jgi:putative selenate reductase molybdopterin-binding subunit